MPARNGANHTNRDIVSGKVAPPAAAAGVMQALRKD
jgi:hypothetical protein